MSKETRKIEVIPYDPDWPKQFHREANQIKAALRSNCLSVHHVGSTSVPGLPAKPKIDIIAEVKNPAQAIEDLESIGFESRGEYNIPMRYFLRSRGNPSINLHVYLEGNPEIELNLTFRDYLQSHPKIRDEYAQLKYKLLKSQASHEKNSSMFSGYNLGKNAFINKVLRLAGFHRLRFIRCTHYEEWEAAKRLRRHYFFDKINLSDPYEWTFDHKDHVHLILYKGVDIKGYAHIQLWPKSMAAIRIIVIEENSRNQGYGRQFLEWIETWLKTKNYKSIHTESSPDSVGYYERLGYTPMPFQDPDGYESDPRDIPMGKVL